MTKKEVLQRLRPMGITQNCKVCARDGIGANMFGMSCGHLAKLKKQTRNRRSAGGAIVGNGESRCADPGETHYITSDAIEYIRKAAKRKKSRNKAS